jgi:hypothetical protein
MRAANVSLGHLRRMEHSISTLASVRELSIVPRLTHSPRIPSVKKSRNHRQFQNALWGAIALAGCACSIANAAEPKTLELETREFKVSVDGKQRGKCTMQIRRREDGSDKMTIDSGLSYNFVVYEYRYHSAGTEVWKNDRLVELENTADFNGTKYVLKANSGANGIRATVNGKKSQLDSDIWVTSYWRLPERLAQNDPASGKGIIPASGTRSAGKKPAQTVSLLDSDKGQHLRGQMTFVGEETITVAGKRKSCAHYRISGGVTVELWYDSTRRLVRQEGVDDGHKSLMEVTRIAAE